MIPSTASITTITPSMALSALVTSPVKSTCPGVSRRLIRYSPSSSSWTRLTAEVWTVMPLCCSISRKSVKSCSPASSKLMMPEAATRESVRVVFP